MRYGYSSGIGVTEIFLIVILVAIAIMFYRYVYNTPNARLTRKLCKNKNSDQASVIRYFVAEGCGSSSTLSDKGYLKMVYKKRDSLDFNKMAISKINLDVDEINEIPPVKLEGFSFKNAFAKQCANGDWVSSTYQVTWLFFSSEQVHVYTYSFNMHDSNNFESTREFFYQDVTSFSISTETETVKSFYAHDTLENEVTSNKFSMIVPGDRLFISIDNVAENDNSIQAMKQKLREKKQQA